MSQEKTEHTLVESLSPAAKPQGILRPTGVIVMLALALVVAALAYQLILVRDMSGALSQQEKLSSKQQQELQTLQQALAGKQQALETRLLQVEAKQSATLDQQAALASMYEALTRNEVQRGLAETEQLLIFASQQLQLTGQPAAALSILTAVDQRLGQLNRPDYIKLRRALASDMVTLKALPQVDTIRITAQLDSLAANVDKLPLLMDDMPAQTTPPPAADKDASWVARVSSEVWHELRSLVEIQRIDNPEAILLSPGQTWFLRENLKLRLLNTRLALLARDEAAFHADLQAAEKAIGRYFDPKSEAARQARATLQQLDKTKLVLRLPDLAASLAEVRAARQMVEGSGK